MKSEDCLKIIREASAMGVKEISFSGGEPLCWQSLDKCISLSDKLNIYTIVYTSGNIDGFETILDSLVRAGLKKIVFSLYASDSLIHERITRRRGSFLLTQKAIQYSVAKNILTDIHFVALKQNYQSLNEVIDFCELLGVSNLSILRFVLQGRGKMLSLMSKEDYNCLRDIIIKNNYRKIKIRTGSPFNFLMINQHPECLSGIDRLTISPDMYIFPCDAFKGFNASTFYTDDFFSNLSGNFLSDCWNRSKYLNLIRSKIDMHGDTCKSCTSFSNCKSGCLAQKMAVYGLLDNSPDPSCLLGNKYGGE
jgi:pyrroloquinoline quinone biosynthesis protein E